MHQAILWADVAHDGIWKSILDILLLLGMAMVMGTVAERLRQSSVIGYLLAGTLIGPGALGWVSNQDQILGIAELGVALLLFAIGLEFSPRELVRLGRLPLIAGPLQIVLTLLGGTGLAWALGLGLRESAVIGAMVSLSSTACVIRVLRDRAEIDSQYGRASLGILLVQDAAVVPLVLMVTVLVDGGTPQAIATRLAISMLMAIGLVVSAVVLFHWVTPRVLRMSPLRRNRDLPILLTVCMAGGAAWAAQALQLSPALGAFLAGVLLAASPFSTQIQADIQPLRIVLVTLFFSAIGMFGDVAWFIEHVGLVLAIAAAIVVGKTVLVAGLTWILGLPLQVAVACGFCLAQIGEFSFVLATIAGQSTNGEPLLPEAVFRAMISATLVALLITPYLVMAGPHVGGWLERLVVRRKPLRRGVASDDPDHEHETIEHAILVIGFGPAGQRVAEELLSEHKDRLVVVDMNIDNVQVAERYGLTAYVGDATQTSVLERAQIEMADVIVIAVPNPLSMRPLIQHVRRMAPGVMVIARSRYHIYSWEYLRAGAHKIVDEENQVGLRLADEVRLVLTGDTHSPTSE